MNSVKMRSLAPFRETEKRFIFKTGWTGRRRLRDSVQAPTGCRLSGLAVVTPPGAPCPESHLIPRPPDPLVI